MVQTYASGSCLPVPLFSSLVCTAFYSQEGLALLQHVLSGRAGPGLETALAEGAGLQAILTRENR